MVPEDRDGSQMGRFLGGQKRAGRFVVRTSSFFAPQISLPRGIRFAHIVAPAHETPQIFCPETGCELRGEISNVLQVLRELLPTLGPLVILAMGIQSGLAFAQNDCHLPSVPVPLFPDSRIQSRVSKLNRLLQPGFEQV